MSTFAAREKMSSGFASLSDIPTRFSSCFLPYTPTLRQKQKARQFYKGRYVDSVSLSKSVDSSIAIDASVHPSQKKNDTPHKITLKVASQSITDAQCTCKAGEFF